MMPRTTITLQSLAPLQFFVLLAACFPLSSDGGDWPQILGPYRNGHAENESLFKSWPDTGPRKLWNYKLGSGYAGAAVAGQRAVVFHRIGGMERVEAINVDSGERIWATDFEATYRGGVNPDTGPRCVPLIHNDKVIVYGAAGDLHCVSLGEGKKLWSRQLYADYGGDEGYFGAGTTPLVFDGKVFVNVGGRKDAGLAALALDDGKTIWTATDERASYSSPTLAKTNGRTQVIFVTRLNAVSVDPASGRVIFQFPFGRRGPTVNAATPLVFNNQLFVSASYGVGCRLMKLGGDDPSEVWSSETKMSSQYTTCVYHDGYLYGTDGREDYSNGKLRCLEAATGKIEWSVDDFGVAHTILADGKLIILGVDGKLVLAQATPAAFRKLASASISNGNITRALPALSNGKLFVRTNDRGTGELICLQIGSDKSSSP